MGLAFVVGIGLLLVGIPLMLAWWGIAPAFFRRGRDPHPRPGPDGSGPPPPRILDAGPILDADLDREAVPAGNAPVSWRPGGDDDGR